MKKKRYTLKPIWVKVIFYTVIIILTLIYSNSIK